MYGALPMCTVPNLEKFVNSGSPSGILCALASAVTSNHFRFERSEKIRDLLDIFASSNTCDRNKNVKALQDVCLRLPLFAFCKEDADLCPLWLEDSHQVGFSHLQIIPQDFSEALVHTLGKANIKTGDGKFLLLRETGDVARMLKSCLAVRQVDNITFIKETIWPRCHQYPSPVRDEIMEQILKDDRIVPLQSPSVSSPAESLASMLCDLKFIQSHGEGLLAPGDVLSPFGDAQLFPTVRFPKLPASNMFRKEDNGLVLQKLSWLGVREDLNEDEIVFVAEHVAKKNDSGLSRVLLSYVSSFWVQKCGHGSCTVHTSSIERMFTALKGIRWLPAMKRPASWFGPWKSEDVDDSLLQADTDEIWSRSHIDEVGYVRPIIDCEALSSQRSLSSEMNASDQELFYKVLGIKSKDYLGDKDLVENLEALRNCWENHDCMQNCKICLHVNVIIGQLYVKMTEKAAEMIRGSWIWLCKRFVDTQRVFKDARAKDLDPFLFELPEPWKKLDVFSSIPQHLSEDTLLDILFQVQEKRVG